MSLGRLPRILVVDDEEFIRDLISQFFTRSDYFVVTAHSGASGIAQCRAGRFDVALVDMRMPGQDGTDVLCELQAIDPNLPTLLMTGYPSVETSMEAARCGAHEVVVKPFRLRDLKARVDLAISSHAMSLEVGQLRAQMGALESAHQPDRETSTVSH